MAKSNKAVFIIVLTIVLGIIGFFFGYLVFGRILGEHIALKTLFAQPKGVLGELGQSLAGIKSARQNVLVSTGVGAAVGFVIGLIIRRK